MKAKDNKETQSLQKLSNSITPKRIDELFIMNDLKALTLIKEELVEDMNKSILLLSSSELSTKEKMENGIKYEYTSELLFCMLDRLDSLENKEVLEQNQIIRRSTYDINRDAIMRTIRDFATKYNKIPNQTEIAHTTGLSRTTIIKHLSDIATDQEFKELRQTSAILLPRIMAKLYTLGIEGDVKALKVFLDFHKHEVTTMFIKNQNNNLQINKIGKDLADEQYI